MRTARAHGVLVPRGASEPEAIADRAAALGLSAIAVTDRAGVYGLPRFAKACRENGIDGLAGAEAVLDDGSRLPLLVRDARGCRTCAAC